MSQHHGRCAADHETTDQIPNQVRSAIAFHVAAGFDTEADIVSRALDLVAGTREAADLQQAIEKLTAQHFAMHRARQAGWNYPTDSMRVDRAFARLNWLGIVARQNLGGCYRCSVDQIEAAVEAAEISQRIKGYVFFTSPMLEHAILTGQLLLFHGTVAPDPLQNSVAETIVRELRNTGLDAHWEGRPGSPVIVDRMVWRKRR
jgi:hypothetical protein